MEDAVAKDLNRSAMMQTGGSPKMLYTSFLLGMIRDFFQTIMLEEVDPDRIERGFSTLTAFTPDKSTRERIWKQYQERRDRDGNITNAAILSTGDLVDYLSECLDLTESSEGAFL